MAKPEWGTKRLCKSCGAKFYDLNKSPVACPKCGAAPEPEAPVRGRRPPPPEVDTKPAPVDTDGTMPDVASDDFVDLEEDEEDEGEDIIEDASELGEDDEDVADVIDPGRGKGEA